MTQPAKATDSASRRGFLGKTLAAATLALRAECSKASGEAQPFPAETSPSSVAPSATVNIGDFGAESMKEVSLGNSKYDFKGKDCAPAIQAAVNALPPYDEKTATGGGVIRVPCGTYLVTRTILLPPGVVLRGERFWWGGSTIVLKPGIWTDPEKPKPIIETRHPKGITHTVPAVGLDNLNVWAFPRTIYMDSRFLPQKGKKKAPKVDPKFQESVTNPGAIVLLWRGGKGSFLRDVNLRGGGFPSFPERLSSRVTLLVPPECNAGPSLWTGVNVWSKWTGILMENARDIVLLNPTYKHPRNWLHMKNCRNIAIHCPGSESGAHLLAEDSQAVIYGGFSGWGGEESVFTFHNSQIAVHSYGVMNRKTALVDIGPDEPPFVLKGPNENPRARGKAKQTGGFEYIGFYPGRGAVVVPPTGPRRFD